ncbi:unnamed protein product, partial [Choristocarpus tenellus]
MLGKAIQGASVSDMSLAPAVETPTQVAPSQWHNGGVSYDLLSDDLPGYAEVCGTPQVASLLDNSFGGGGEMVVFEGGEDDSDSSDEDAGDDDWVTGGFNQHNRLNSWADVQSTRGTHGRYQEAQDHTTQMSSRPRPPPPPPPPRRSQSSDQQAELEYFRQHHGGGIASSHTQQQQQQQHSQQKSNIVSSSFVQGSVAGSGASVGLGGGQGSGGVYRSMGWQNNIGNRGGQSLYVDADGFPTP